MMTRTRHLVGLLVILTIVVMGQFLMAGVSSNKGGKDAFRQRKLVLKDVTIAYDGSTTSGAAFGGTKIWDMNAGRILIHGVVVDLTVAFPTNFVASGSGIDVACGTAVVGDSNAMSGTDLDLCANISLDPYVLNTTNDVHGQLAAAAQFDGTATAKDMYLNGLVDAGDFTTSVTGTYNGVIVVTYSELGDY